MLQDPQFLVIGAQKAGTTWLNLQLEGHPEIYIPPTKELHYFDGVEFGHMFLPTNRFFLNNWYAKFYRRQALDAIRYSFSSGFSKKSFALLNYHFGNRNLRSYIALFENRDKKISGEVTPAYSALKKETIQYVLKSFPKVKVLIILRDPIQRAWSSIRHNLRAENKSTDSLSQKDISQFLEQDDRGEYIKILDNWTTCCDDRQLKILFYDDLLETPDQFLKSVFNFLEVDPTWKSPFLKKKVNVGISTNEIPPDFSNILKKSYIDELTELELRLKYISKHPRKWLEAATNL